MKLFRGFAIVVATICFCSTSQSQDEESITILMDDDLLDRPLTIKHNMKYTIRMKSTARSDYKLSISIVEVDCMGATNEQFEFESIKEKDDGIIRDRQRTQVKVCGQADYEDTIRIYDSSTSSVEILGPVKDIKLKFLITAYFDVSEDSQCPNGFATLCGQCDKLDYDSQVLGKKSTRCISSDLKCNGRNNCANCQINDESTCSNNPAPPTEEEGFSGFRDTQYMLTILLAGLFFIMSPIVIVLVLFYHKRMNPTTRQREILRAHRDRNAANETITISRSPLRNEAPPTYEDVHDTKTPPPNFDDVVVQLTNENEVTPTNTNSNVPQGISNNV